jgi:hypothetical protein
MIFDPHAGDGTTLVASYSDSQRWQKLDYDAIRSEREADIRERDMRAIGFGQRQSVCG